MGTNEEFIKALSMIQPIIEEPAEYRLHYDESGEIIMCSMRQHPENTQYLVVTKNEYENYYQYIIDKGKLKKIDRTTEYRVQLKRSDQGYKTVKNHANIILENEQYTDIEYYDNN